MKRFVETTRWNDPWFRKLPSKMKAFWGYICDVCDPAGVWVIDFELATFFIGEEVTQEEAFNALKGRVVDLKNGKWVIPQFIPFQYGKLSRDCRPHDRVFEALSKHKLKIDPVTLALGYPKGIQRVSNTLEEEEEYKEEEKGGAGGVIENGLFGDSEPPKTKPQELRIKAVSILAFLNESANRKFEACDETLKPIIRRLMENHPVEEIQKMIRREVALDPLSKWHQPSTLFGVNFPGCYGNRDLPIKPHEKYNPNSRPGADRNKGTFNEGKAAQYDAL